jgi:hypothetical protein
VRLPPEECFYGTIRGSGGSYKVKSGGLLNHREKLLVGRSLLYLNTLPPRSRFSFTRYHDIERISPSGCDFSRYVTHLNAWFFEILPGLFQAARTK